MQIVMPTMHTRRRSDAARTCVEPPRPSTAHLLSVDSLADAASTRAQRRTAVAFSLLLSATCLTVLQFVGRPFPWINGPAFFTAYDILSAVLDSVTAFLLFAQFRQVGTLPMLCVAVGYTFAACMALLHVSSIGGLLFPHRLVSEENTSFWIRICWLSSVPAAGILCALTQNAPRISRPGQSVRRAILIAALLVTAVFVLTSPPFIEFLPDLSPKPQNFTNTYLTVLPIALGVQVTAIVLLLWKTKGRTVLTLWLMMAILATADDTIAGWLVLGVLPDRRYSVSFYIARCAGLASDSVLLLAFLNEIALMYRRLANSQHTLKRLVAERTADLSTLVGERDLLLREVYHRVKNNLQTMDSLVYAEQRRIQDPAAKEAFVRLRNRVFALGLVHKQLMASDDLETFSIQPFLEELVQNLSVSSGLDQSGFEIVTQVEPVSVTLDVATPIGLLVTELLSNAIKHGGAGTIHVGFCRAGDDAELVVANGNGTVIASPDAWEPNIGSRVIDGLVRQLRGKKIVKRDDGTRVEVRIPMDAG